MLPLLRVVEACRGVLARYPGRAFTAMAGCLYFSLPCVRLHISMVDRVKRSVVELAGDVAELLLAQLDPLADEMDAAIAAGAPDLVADTVIAAEMSASSRANARRLLTSMIRRDGRTPPTDVPPEALDIARTIVRRGIEIDVLYNDYCRL